MPTHLRPRIVRSLAAALPAAVAFAVVLSGTAGASARTASSTAAVSCVPPVLNVSAALAGARVTVSPGPGTRDASSTTQLSFLGVPAGELSSVLVTGSDSGAHPGQLSAYSEGGGASFLPTQPFAAGELVTVHAVLSEAGKRIPFAWSFSVAVPDRPGLLKMTEAVRSVPVSVQAPAPKDFQSFHSQPQIRPPDVTVSAAAAATGDLFLAPKTGIGQHGPMILDEHGGLVWFRPLSPASARASNFRVQEYEGKPVLTWWQNPLVVGKDRSAGVVIEDSSYRTVAVVRAGNGYQADLHEFQITPQGTALLTVYDAIECDLSSVGGPKDSAVSDTLLQEIDLKTGLVMYEWHSLDHVPLANSYASAVRTSAANPYDYFHINSIDTESDGDLLVGSRNTWAAYDVDPKSGQLRWELGGRHSSFALGPGAAPAWEHDAREQPNGTITIFDNGASPRTHPQSRAIELTLDTAGMTATLARSYEHRNPLVADSQGNVQALSSGDWMVGWGQAGYLSEVNPAGGVLFNAHLPPGWDSYRAYALPWTGAPSAPPAVAVQNVKPARGAARSIVFASWNGASEVASWRVLAGRSPTALAVVRGAPKTGFETALATPSSMSGGYVAVQALNTAGAVIGVSATIKG